MNEYNKIVNLFLSKAKNITGVYDVLLRGPRGNINEELSFTPNWSDLDFSIIVEKVNSDVRKEIKEIYERLKQETDIKISIILVDTEDFFSKFHIHGMQPMIYSFALYDSQSLLKKNLDYIIHKKHSFDSTIRENCYSHLSCFVHELRDGYMKCGNDKVARSLFCRHLARRTKNITWNAIFFMTGSIEIDISSEQLVKCFPKLDPDFILQIGRIKSNWENIRNDFDKVNEVIDYIFHNLEIVYSDATAFFNNYVSQKEGPAKQLIQGITSA